MRPNRERLDGTVLTSRPDSPRTSSDIIGCGPPRPEAGSSGGPSRAGRTAARGGARAPWWPARRWRTTRRPFLPRPRSRTGACPCSLLIDRLQAHEIMSETAYFSTPLHWNDENHPESGMLQARVRELWKAGHQHRWPRLVYHQVGSPTALPLQDMRGNRQHEHGHSVFRPSLHSQGVRPSSEPASRGREHFCYSPSHGSFPQHRRTLARACLSGGRALQPAHAAGLRAR